MDNLLLLTDSYKVTQWPQYPPGTNTVYSYFESRGGRFIQTCFFGLQYTLMKYLEGTVVTKEKIEEADAFFQKHFGRPVFNREGWEYIVEKHNGKLPIRIKAVAEGSIVPILNVLMTIENTDHKCYWLTNYLETLLVQVWYPTTVATLSREIRKLILKSLEETGDPNLIHFKLHDFGFRGVSSVESAGIGGLAHLVNFLGTDTIQSLVFGQKYYDAPMAGFSIPATEHSTITSWGREKEVDAFKNMLEKYPSGLIACVSDSFDIYKACEKLWGEILKDDVLNREGCLVIRPDSGDPPTVVLKCLEILGEKFGYETNIKGYKVLNPKVRIIQGDGVDYDSIGDILRVMKNHGWSADNIAFGMGGALLQKLNRDTQKFAFKCSSININGTERSVYKSPITDKGKQSKEGRLKLIQLEGPHGPYYRTLPTQASGETDLLKTVFLNGEVTLKYNLESVRERAIIVTALELLNKEAVLDFGSVM